MSHDPFQEREAEKYANPIPSREFIIEHLTKREKPANREELAVELNIEGEEQIEALAAACARWSATGNWSLPAVSATRCQNVSTC